MTLRTIDIVGFLMVVASFACIPAFLFFWWKKRKSRKVAGENYLEDSSYKSYRLKKKIAGWLCIVFMVIGIKLIMTPMTPEEYAQYKSYNEKRETEKAAEKVKLEEEQAKIAAEQKAEQERIDEEKRKSEEKQVKIAAEKDTSNKNALAGLFSEVKSGLEDIAEVTFGEDTDEEIFIGNANNGFVSYDFYILPGTTRPLIDGIILETREGYIIDVKTKKADTDEVVGVVPFYFYNNNDFWASEGHVKYKVGKNGSKSHITDEKIVMDIYNASKKFSILK